MEASQPIGMSEMKIAIESKLHLREDEDISYRILKLFREKNKIFLGIISEEEAIAIAYSELYGHERMSPSEKNNGKVGDVSSVISCESQQLSHFSYRGWRGIL